MWRADGDDYRMPITDFVTGIGDERPGRRRRPALGPPARLALRGRTAYRKLAPSPLGRSGIVVIGARRRRRRTFVLSITAATVRPYVFTLPSVDVDAVRRAHARIPDDAWTDDPHGDPDWRRAVSLVLAEQICAEL